MSMAFLTVRPDPGVFSDAEHSDALSYGAEGITCITPPDSFASPTRFRSASIERFIELLSVHDAPWESPTLRLDGPPVFFKPPENFIASLSVHHAPRKSSTRAWAKQLLKQLRGGTKLVGTPLGSLPASPPPLPPPGSPSEPADSTAGVLAALALARALPLPDPSPPSPPIR